MLVFSQTRSFFWDEGFHILAAYLIRTGKRPYLDFFFPQTPLNAYWNAAWMAIFGPSWRVVHAVAALVTISSVVLMVDYLFGLFPDSRVSAMSAAGGSGVSYRHYRGGPVTVQPERLGRSMRRRRRRIFLARGARFPGFAHLDVAL
jgi:hypothetical protein